MAGAGTGGGSQSFGAWYQEMRKQQDEEGGTRMGGYAG